MTPSRFHAFVLLAGMRTGSNFLQANLNAIPGITCHGEMFNPHFIGAQGITQHLGIDLTARDRDPLALLDRMIAQGPGLVGFRFFHDHDLRVLDRVLPDPGVAKIILTRNPLDSYISWKIAQVTGQWKLTSVSTLRSAKVAFDAAEFTAWQDRQQGFQQGLRRALQLSGQTAFHVGYDDVQDVSVLNGIARFLGVEARLDALDTTLKRQNPGDVLDKVTNPDEVQAALARLGSAGRDHPPESEPRRTAAIPGYAVAADAPLLFMPIPGGPWAEINAWMEGFGPGGVRSGLTLRELRHWKSLHPGHRSFAVLRDPLDRAHAVFQNRILGGTLPEFRQRLIRSEAVDLPPPGDPTPLDPEVHRKAFLGFLRLVRQGLAGQTGLPVDACWASQTAVLQGHAMLCPPDYLLREDNLAEALRRLAQDCHMPMPPFTPAPLPAMAADAEIEQVVREAYARDYLELGFGPGPTAQAA